MEDKNILELLKKAKNEDKDAIEKILLMYDETIDFVFNKYISDVNGLDVDDIKQQGRLGILDAIKSFDESKNILFKTYLSVCVRNRMINEVKSIQKRLSIIDIRAIDDIDEDGNPVLDIASDVDIMDEIIYSDMVDRFKEKMNEVLSKDEKKVLACFLNNKSIKEIAKELNLTEKQVHNAKTRIKEKIAKYMF